MVDVLRNLKTIKSHPPFQDLDHKGFSFNETGNCVIHTVSSRGMSWKDLILLVVYACAAFFLLNRQGGSFWTNSHFLSRPAPKTYCVAPTSDGQPWPVDGCDTFVLIKKTDVDLNFGRHSEMSRMAVFITLCISRWFRFSSFLCPGKVGVCSGSGSTPSASGSGSVQTSGRKETNTSVYSGMMDPLLPPNGQMSRAFESNENLCVWVAGLFWTVRKSAIRSSRQVAFRNKRWNGAAFLSTWYSSINVTSDANFSGLLRTRSRVRKLLFNASWSHSYLIDVPHQQSNLLLTFHSHLSF